MQNQQGDPMQQAPQPPSIKHGPWKTLITLGVLVLVVVGGAGGYMLFMQKNPEKGSKEFFNSILPTSMLESQQKSDWQAALNERDAILDDANASTDEKALAVVTSTKVKFKVTGNVSDMLSSIADVKKVFLDENVDLTTRVLALNKLAFGYCGSGRDPRAFEELYKDAPFSNYKVPNDPDASARNLAEWSYSIKPTAFAAVRVARWYSQMYAKGTKYTDAQREEFGTTARKYLSISEDLNAKEIASAPDAFDFKQDPMYVEYYFWRARDYSWLASRGDAVYKARYKQAYEDAILAATDANSESALNTLSFIRQYYARYLVKLDNDRDAAKTQLDALAASMNALQKPLSSPWVRVIRNERRFHPKGDTWTGIAAMMKISPEYDAAVNKVLALQDPNDATLPNTSPLQGSEQ